MLDSPASPTPYEVLGVPATADQNELRRAYRRLLRETHPDTGGSADRFHAVQAAWERIGDPTARAQYDRGRATGAGEPEHAPFAPPSHPPKRPRSSVRARSYGHPGGSTRERFLVLMREWAGRGAALEDPYDPALVRSAPLELRRLLSKALAEEATARAVSGLGIAYSIWNDVLAGRAPQHIDHVVLGPTGLFVLESEDWGPGELRLVRGELVGEAMPEDHEPLATLAQNAKALSRELRVKVTASILVVPDEALSLPMLPVERGRASGAVVVRRSVLPHLLRTGAPGRGDVAAPDMFELRARLQDRIRYA
jgi:curved DNA-binding protein CbpA